LKIRFLLHDVYGRGGGVLTVTIALARELAERHDVELVSLVGYKPRPVHAMPDNVGLTTLMGRHSSGEWEKLRPRRGAVEASRPSRVVPRQEPRFGQYSRLSDRVLARYLRSLAGGAVVTMQPGLNVALARLGSPRYVRVAEDHRPFGERSIPTLAAYAQHADGLDAFLALTETDADAYRNLLGRRVPVRKMVNGTPLYDGPASSLGSKLVLAAGRLERSKGFDLLVAAWGDVARRHPDWKLHIYGEGDLRSDLQAQIDDLGLRGTVVLKGFSDDLQRRMAEASLFVLSSRAEGYGMVLAEAMACGVPVVSTDCPSGPREIVTDRVDGLLVANLDAAALAVGITEMIEMDPEKRRVMGQAALDKARSRSHAAVAVQWEELLTALASPSPTGPR